MDVTAVRRHVEQDPFARFLDIEIMDLREGYGKAALTVADHMMNFHDVPHGGVIFSLADAAFGAACNSHGQAAVALNINISFVAAVPVGTRLISEATEESLGRRIGQYKLSVVTEDGALVATGQGTAYRRSRLLGE